MAIPINKLAPTAVVVAAVSCCGWPYVFPSDDGGKKAAAMPEIQASQLSPHILPPPARDPFRPAGEPVVRGVKPTTVARVATAKAVAGAGAIAGKGAIASPPPSAARGKPPADPFSGLSLNATSILAQQRFAIINGRVYAERERLKNKDPSAPPPAGGYPVVARILPDRVLLECDGRTATLGYMNAVARKKPNPAGGVGGPAGRGAAPLPSAGSPHLNLRNQSPL